MDIEKGSSGKVLGLGGLLGSGRTETARMLFGIDPSDSGMLEIEGTQTKIGTPAKAMTEASVSARKTADRRDRCRSFHPETSTLALQAKRGIFRFLSRKRQECYR